MKMKEIFTAVVAAVISYSAVADVQVSAGRWHTLIVDNGNMLSAGDNRFGALGHEMLVTEARDELSVSMPLSVVKTDASYVRSIVLLENGDVCIFGYKLGELPKPVYGFTGASDVAVNDLGAYVLVNGEVFHGWSTESSQWLKVAGLENITAISARGKHLLATNVNGRVFSYGQNQYGQLGLGDKVARTEVAEEITELPTIIKAVAGEFHSMFIDTENLLWVVGHDGNGKLGLAGPGDLTLPTPVMDMADVIDVDGGNKQTIALRANGTVWAAGWHNHISDDAYNASSVFVQINGLYDIQNVTSGYDALYASSVDTVYSWGGNLYGKLALGDNIERHDPVAAYIGEAPEVILPEIASVAPGGSYIIEGTNFGNEIGIVSMDGFEFQIKSWTDTVIHIENPPYQMIGDLYVTDANGLVSNSWYVTLEPDAPSETPLPEEPTEPEEPTDPSDEMCEADKKWYEKHLKALAKGHEFQANKMLEKAYRKCHGKSK